MSKVVVQRFLSQTGEPMISIAEHGKIKPIVMSIKEYNELNNKAEVNNASK